MKVVVAALSVVAIATPTLSSPGLKLFRKAGRDGNRCANCHSPDGIEISAFGFATSDVVRRAGAHLDAADSELIAKYLRSSRIARHPLKPDSARPLQPGGAVLPGHTAAAREIAFARELGRLVPELCGAPIRSEAVALRARDRLLKLDPRTVPIGIPFNLLSEDGFHGPKHATVADWIPDVPINLTPELLRLQDAYLADPSDRNLAAMETAVAAMPPQSSFQQLALAKYRSLLLLQNAIRHGGPKAARLDHVRLVGPGNPFWEVAEVAHRNSLGDTQMLSVPAAVLDKKRTVPMAQQMREIRLPWYWIGWSVDPTLAHVEKGLSRTGVRADYFTKFLWSDGPYPIHMAFMLSKKLVDSGFGADADFGGLPRHYEIQFSNFLIGDPLLQDDAEWRGMRPLVFKISANAFRLSLLLLDADLKRTGACLRPESQLTQIEYMRHFFRGGGGDYEDLALCDRVAGELKAAHVDGR
ncbi:MAG: hypothetical protein ACYC96_11010 [Fimbriimonadaceae bacterium]